MPVLWTSQRDLVLNLFTNIAQEVLSTLSLHKSSLTPLTDILEAQGIIPPPPAASSSRTSRTSSLERHVQQRKRSHSLINDEPYIKKRRAIDPELDRPLPSLEPNHSPSSSMAELYPELYSDTLGDDLAALEASQIRSPT